MKDLAQILTAERVNLDVTALKISEQFVEENMESSGTNVMVRYLTCHLPRDTLYVPVGAGERLSLSLSLIIAVSVYQVVSAELVPTGVDSTPILSKV